MVEVFWFLVCYATTQVAIQVQQERIQVVRSNKVARRRLTESNGTSAMDFCFFLVCRHKASAPSTSGTHTGGVQ